jgi:hypothetical protein
MKLQQIQRSPTTPLCNNLASRGYTENLDLPPSMAAQLVMKVRIRSGGRQAVGPEEGLEVKRFQG